LIRQTILALPLLILACAPFPVMETASLPRDSIQGAGDPTRAAITTASTSFDVGGRFTTRPALTARTIANLEYLAVNTVNNPLLDNAPATLQSQLLAARQEWRAALGIPSGVPAQQVINDLYGASRALDAGQPGGEATLARLRALPALPQTAAAAASAAEALRTRNSQGQPIR
jgi:hypothetical protein